MKTPLALFFGLPSNRENALGIALKGWKLLYVGC